VLRSVRAIYIHVLKYSQDEEFFDCCEVVDETHPLGKWSSMELTPFDPEGESSCGSSVARTYSTHVQNSSQQINFRRVQSMREQVMKVKQALLIEPSYLILGNLF